MSMYSDIGYHHVATYRAGESGYYAPRARGTCDVWHDSKRYVYTLSRVPRRQIRAMIDAAFADFGRCDGKVTGRYPSYTYETI